MTVGNYVYKLNDIHKSYETACQLNKLSYSECIQGNLCQMQINLFYTET